MLADHASSIALEDLVFLDGAVSLVDADDEGQPERQRGDADDDGGEDQHMRQRIGIDGECRIDDRRSAADDLSRRDIEQVDRGLEQRQADQLLHHVAAGDDDVETGDHEEDGDPLVVVGDDLDERGRSSRAPGPAKA